MYYGYKSPASLCIGWVSMALKQRDNINIFQFEIMLLSKISSRCENLYFFATRNDEVCVGFVLLCQRLLEKFRCVSYKQVLIVIGATGT